MSENRNPRGYWTKEQCLEEAKKYNTLNEFRRNSIKAYTRASKNKWVKDYTWLATRKPKGYWDNYNNCRDESKKYSTRSEFNKNASKAYEVSRINNWLGSFTWLKNRNSNPSKYWTKERCETEAKKYTTKAKFSKESNGAYNASRKNGWIDDYNWFIKPTSKPKGYWSYEKCLEVAKTCSTRKEFATKFHNAYYKSIEKGWIDKFGLFNDEKEDKKVSWTKESVEKIARNYKYKSDFAKDNSGAYDAALRKGWMKEFDWFEPKIRGSFDRNAKIYVIYGYFDFQNKTCYIGLSMNIKKRHAEHKLKNRDTGKYDSAMEYFSNKYGFLPKPTLLEEELTASEAQKQEDYYIKFFSDRGYNLLNKAKAGSLGGTFKKWTKETCYEEAKKYKTLAEFRDNANTAYSVSLENNWLEDYTWLERKLVSKWTEDLCKKESKKYKTITEFRENSYGAYLAARKNNWLKDYTWLEETFRWTEETCMTEAKKYKLRSEFHDKSHGAYRVARDNGWLKNYDWFIESPRTKWTKEACYNEAKKYTKLSDFREKSSIAYGAASKKGWIKNYTWLERERTLGWNKEMCYEEAKKYRTKKEFRRNASRAYELSRVNNWIKDYTWFEKKNKNKE